ncbi:hypothetical protein P8452_66306 [Trifolium repens]|nr:hypothetical protein P8452_66306 [Trifolium repens]
MDVETGKVISQLQEIAENEESDNEAFEAVFGKERPGRIRRIDRLQNAFKALVQHCNPQFNVESIEDLLGFSHGDAKESGPQMHSSTLIHAPDHGEQVDEDDEEDDGVRDEEDGGLSDDSQEDDNSDDDGISAEFQDDDISDGEDDEDDDDDEFDKLK